MFSKPLLIMVAVLVLLQGITGWMLKRSIQKNGELVQITDQYERANVVLAESVQRAYRSIEIADRVNKEVENNRKLLQKQVNDQKHYIKELGEKNETVDQYLNTPIPDALYDWLRENQSNQRD